MGLIIEIIFILVLAIIVLVNIGIRIMYSELAQIPNKTHLSGFEIARIVSSKMDCEEPHIIKKNGKYLDHYNYERNVIKLSKEVFDGSDIYASLIALNVALETDKTRINAAKGHKFSSFLVLLSYIIIISGAFLNNPNIILFGFILFILAFFLEAIILNLFGKTKEEVDEIYKIAQEENLIEPYEEYKDKASILILINIARLPYGFINYFR